MPWGPVVRVLKAAVLGEDLRIFISFMLMNQNEIYPLNFIYPWVWLAQMALIGFQVCVCMCVCRFYLPSNHLILQPLYEKFHSLIFSKSQSFCASPICPQLIKAAKQSQTLSQFREPSFPLCCLLCAQA